MPRVFTFPSDDPPFRKDNLQNRDQGKQSICLTYCATFGLRVDMETITPQKQFRDAVRSRAGIENLICIVSLSTGSHLSAVLAVNARYYCHQYKCEPLIAYISLRVNMRTVVDRDETPQMALDVKAQWLISSS